MTRYSCKARPWWITTAQLFFTTITTITAMSEYATYVLKLKEDRYYVGKSAYLMKRLLQHFNSGGAKWTQLHKPVAVLEVHDDDLERELTLKYMKMYGVSAVRGFAWCQVNFTKRQDYLLTEALKMFSQL